MKWKLGIDGCVLFAVLVLYLKQLKNEIEANILTKFSKYIIWLSPVDTRHIYKLAIFKLNRKILKKD